MSIPFQATHTADDGRYYMVDGCKWFYANHMGHWKMHWSGAPTGLKKLDKKPWSGPEDGLPQSSWCSAGKMVQVMSLPTHHHEDVSIYLSKPSKIVASYTDDEGDTFLMLRIDCDFGTGYECFAAHRVLPAKTENQIAADKRESAIREFMDVVGIDCRVTASKAVDAGFKREVV